MVQSCWVVFFVVFLHLPSWTQLCESFFLVCNMFQHQLCNSKYTSSNIDTSQNTAINMFDKGTKQPLSKAKNEVRSINMFNFQGGWGLHIVFIYKSNISYDDYIYIYIYADPSSRPSDGFRRQPPSRLLVRCFAPWSHVCPVEARSEGITVEEKS